MVIDKRDLNFGFRSWDDGWADKVEETKFFNHIVIIKYFLIGFLLEVLVVCE